MKKGSFFMLSVCLLCIGLIIGIFLGRNSRKQDVLLNKGVTQFEKPTSLTMQDTDTRLDINTASKLQMMELPGIGETLAQRIIEYRTEYGPFQSTDELLNVAGIGEKTLSQMETLIKIGE